jgi:drug/metabolite transporter (DMT)-like permease
MVVAGALILTGWSMYHKRLPRWHAQDTLSFLSIIFFHIYAAYVLDLWALQGLSSFKSSFFFNLSPFITALFSYLLFHEGLSRKKWIGLSIGVLGFIPEIVEHMPHEQMFGSFAFISLPELAMFGAVTCACVGWITMRQLLHTHRYDTWMINGIGMLFGGVLALATSFFAEGWVPAPVNNWPMFALLTGTIIIVVNAVFYNFYGLLLKTYTATFLSFAGFLCPLFAALFGLVFLHEQLTWSFFFSSAVVLVGLTIFYLEELKASSIRIRQSGATPSIAP